MSRYHQSERPLRGRFAIHLPDAHLIYRPHFLTQPATWGSHQYMKSRLADTARRCLSEDLRAMTPEQRLQAFVVHCQLMEQLRVAGQVVRERLITAAVRDAD